MSLQDRIESLRARHRTLEEAIDQEISRCPMLKPSLT